MHKPDPVNRELKAWGNRINRDLPPVDIQPPIAQAPRLDPSPRRSGFRVPALAPFGFAGLALAVVLLWVWSVRRPDSPPPPSVADTPSTENGFTVQKAFFQEIARLFQGHSVWISGDPAAMLLDVEPTPISSQKPELVLRMEIERQSEEGTWQTVWQRDVLAHENHWTQAPAAISGHETVSVWIHSLAANIWLVESHFLLPGIQDLEARKQITLTGSGAPADSEPIALGGGLRLVQRLMPLHTAEWGDNV